MANPITVSVPVIGAPDKEISFETGLLAPQAGGAVVATLGRTKVLVTATAAKSVRDGIDFFPLTVDIEERMYAAGKIPGSFFRREGRAPDAAILTCRLIDRPLRPSFPEGFRNEVHIVGTVLGADQENPYDILALNAASAALMISDVPFDGPIGAVRMAFDTEGNWVPFPTFEEGDASSFEIVVAGRELDDGDVAVMMVEAGGTEAAWANFENGAPKIDEGHLARALEEAKPHIKRMCELQHDLVAEAGSRPTMDYVEQIDYSPEVYQALKDAGLDRIAAAQAIVDKAERKAAEEAARAELIAEVGPRFADDPNADRYLKAAFRSLTKEAVRRRIVNEGVRIDGRGVKDLRPLSAAVGVLPTAHGSGLFQRGETQVLNVITLGMGRMDQMIDGITPVTKKRYMHHYNMPPFAGGETGFMRGPKRREIGHGALAEKALVPVVPSMDEFPYVLRLVSEVLSSNGSTSMASVCSSSLSLMDAGVPTKAAVAGIAMGLVYADGKYIALTDILGAEDAFGDMDFKVAGTADFVTALQLDTKIDGIPADVLAQALQQAKEARLQILEVMNAAIAAPRSEVGPTAPKIVSFTIPLEKIGEVIGPKGKVINAIQAETGADISVDDDGSEGTVAIASSDIERVNEAERQIRLILDPPTADVGVTYPGRVVNITKFGAFVNILPGRDGLVHISKLGGGKRINQVEDVLALGDDMEVVVEDIDPNGKISLRPISIRGEALPEPTAEELAAAAESRSRDRDRGGRGGGGRDRDRGRDGGRDGRDRDRDRDRGDRGRDRDRSASNGDTPAAAPDADFVSFEDTFESELREEFGELGPVPDTGAPAGDGDGAARRRRRRRR